MPSGFFLQVAYLQDPLQNTFAQAFDPWSVLTISTYCLLSSLLTWCQKSQHGNIKSQFLSYYCIAATGMIKYQGAVFTTPNKPYFHHPHGNSKGLRLCVKLLTWLKLIYMMNQSLVCNSKAIRRDLYPQQNQTKEGYFPTNKKMAGWR